MPVPQKINLIVEQASCLFLRMVQHLSLFKLLYCGPESPPNN
ncbi:hypothetical protein QUB28_21530 [Microcoleus sp. B4-C3]